MRIARYFSPIWLMIANQQLQSQRFGSRYHQMQTLQPTPTCAHFRTTDLPCLKCNGEMKLALIEPGGPNFEKLTYRCEPCDITESFLMAIKSGGDLALRRYARTINGV